MRHDLYIFGKLISTHVFLRNFLVVNDRCLTQTGPAVRDKGGYGEELVRNEEKCISPCKWLTHTFAATRHCHMILNGVI